MRIARLWRGGRSVRAIIAAATSVGALSASAADGTWTLNNSGTWSTPANWNPGIPDGVEDVANITANISGTRTVTINTTPRTVGTLNIGDTNASHSYVLAASGGGTLTFDNGVSAAVLTQTSTSTTTTISAPLILNGSLNVTNASTNAGRSLNITGSMTGGTAGTKTITVGGSAAGPVVFDGAITGGAGDFAIIKSNTNNTLTLGGANTFAGGVTTDGGTLNIDHNSALGNAAGILTIGGGVIGNTSGGVITVANNNAQVWNGDFAIDGNHGIDFGTGGVTMSASRSLTLSGDGAFTFGGVISDGGSALGLTTANGSTGDITAALVLNGVNAYTGGTTINGGLVRFGNASALPATGSLAIGAGGALAVAGPHTTLAGWLGDSRLVNTATGALALTANSGENFAPGAAGFATVSLGAELGAAVDYTGAYTPAGTTYYVGGGGGSITFSNNNAFTGPGQNVIAGNGGGGTVIVTGSNDYTGATTINAGTLQVGNGGTTGSIGVTSGVVTNGTLAFNRSDDVLFNPPISGTGDLHKTGTGTLTLGVAASHGGLTIIDRGTLTSTVPQALSGQLRFGSADTITTAGTLDLTNISASFGSLLVQTNTASANTIKIGAGQMLTINGNVRVGSNRAASTTAVLNAIGGGAMIVTSTGSGSTFLVGGQTSSSGQGTRAIADFSELSSFDLTLNTGNGLLRINPVNGTNVSGRFSTMTLPGVAPGTSTLIANELAIGNSGQNNSATQINSLRLGAGVNTLRFNTINIATGTRDAGEIVFDGATGTVIIQDAAGTGPATFNLATGNGNTGLAATNTFDVTGHHAELLLGAVNIGTQPRAGQLNNFFNFDQGTLTMASLTMSTKGSSGSTTNGGNRITESTMNLGGGIVNITNGVLNLGNVTSTSGNNATLGNFDARGTINITGGTVTIGATSGTSIRMAGAIADTLASGTVNFTGGSTTLSGDIVYVGGAGTTSATVKVDGGTVDMSGKAIGTLASPISTILASGSLGNLGELNGGGTFDKTTGGTLTLTGTSTYTGPTTVSAGTLLVNGSIVSNTTVQPGGTLGGGGQIFGTLTAVGGAVAPGASAGALASGAFDLQAPATLAVELGGLNSGTQYDQLSVTGAVTLAGSLAGSLLGGFVPQPGDTFFILLNDGTDAVNGTFALQPEGSQVSFGGATFEVTYLANGDAGAVGNDVALVTIPEPGAAGLLATAALGLLARRRRQLQPLT